MEDESLQSNRPLSAAVEAAWLQLSTGGIEATRLGGSDNQHPGAPRVLFPGAFNPLHDGHRQMAAVAANLLDAPVEFELSIENVDKPPLDCAETEARCRQLHADTLWLTRAATFVAKARLFPNVTFVVGTDTIRRIAEPRYYADDSKLRDQSITELAEVECHFLVFGRHDGMRFETLADLELPTGLRSLCRQVPEAIFRQDVSSRELREDR